MPSIRFCFVSITANSLKSSILGLTFIPIILYISPNTLLISAPVIKAPSTNPLAVFRSLATLALLCGTEVGTGKGTAYSPVQELTVATKQVTLEQEPKNGKIKVYDKTDNTLVDSSKYTVTAKAVEFTDETFDGKTIKVMPYEFDVKGDTVVSEVVISSDKFPSAGKLVLKGVEKNDKTKEMAEITIICENAQPSTDFSLSTSSEVAPAETEIKLTVQTQTGNKKLMTVQEKML